MSPFTFTICNGKLISILIYPSTVMPVKLEWFPMHILPLLSFQPYRVGLHYPYLPTASLVTNIQLHTCVDRTKVHLSTWRQNSWQISEWYMPSEQFMPKFMLPVCFYSSISRLYRFVEFHPSAYKRINFVLVFRVSRLQIFISYRSYAM